VWERILLWSNATADPIFDVWPIRRVTEPALLLTFGLILLPTLLRRKENQAQNPD
jgi:hypothetical protein